jgi:hypothetical protein
MTRLAVLMVLVVSMMVRAQPCERPEGSTPRGIAGLSDEARLQFLSKLLAEESGRAHAWVLTWGAVYGGLGIGQLALMPLFSREEQPDWYWSAAATGVGLAFTLLGKPPVLEEGPAYAQKVKVAPAADACSLIAQGERLLRAGAQAEDASRRWYLHAGNVLFNVGLGLLLGFGYGHWRAAAVNTLVGIAIGETNMLSSPAHLISGWQQYRQGESPQALRFQLIPTAGPGLGVLMHF